MLIIILQKIYYSIIFGETFNMARFTHAIFDLDGTLTDNTLGIKNALKYALKQMQIADFSEDILERFIGPPLQWGFSSLFGMNERNTNLAVEYFRSYYNKKGWCENVPYPGVFEMMEELYRVGIKMYIATSKLEKFAMRIVRHFEFDKYIIQINGADYGGEKATKTDIITSLMEAQKLVPSKETVMIGDTVFDVEGGRDNGLSTIAVAYGFGRKDELQKANPDFFVGDVEELFEILCG